MPLERSLHSLSDDELLKGLAEVLHQSRRVEAELVAHILEVDARKLWAREACPSMHAYCVEVLHLSEAEAFLRIAVARASRDYPLVLEMLADGRLHLSGIAKLVPHLTQENAAGLLARATHRSKRQIEELVVELAPRPDVAATIRKLPARPCLTVEAGVFTAQAEPPAPLRPDGVGSKVTSPVARPVEPLAPARFKVQFTADAALRDKLERLQNLMGVGTDDLASVIDRAVTETLERLESRRFARTNRRRPAPSNDARTSRYLPAGIRRAVFVRDGGRCRFKDASGRRCAERHRLEYHHRLPFGMGGGPTLHNVCLMCRAHNQYLADQDYGMGVMDRHRHPATSEIGSRLRPDAVGPS